MIKDGWWIVIRMYLPMALLIFAILLPGPMTLSAQPPASKPPAGLETPTNAPVKQRQPVPEIPSWSLDRLVNEAVAGNPETLSKRASFESELSMNEILRSAVEAWLRSSDY